MSAKDELEEQGQAPKQTGAEDDPKLQKLKAWTEKRFPIELRRISKTPFLHQFTCSELREGIIHGIGIREELLDEFDSLEDIWFRQYEGKEKHEAVSLRFASSVAKDRLIDGSYDYPVMIDMDVLEDEMDPAKAIRGWKNRTRFREERRLRYTICVLSHKNDRTRERIKELRRAIAVAQGDIEA